MSLREAHYLFDAHATAKLRRESTSKDPKPKASYVELLILTQEDQVRIRCLPFWYLFNNRHGRSATERSL